jgi:hypothetical protein
VGMVHSFGRGMVLPDGDDGDAANVVSFIIRWGWGRS